MSGKAGGATAWGGGATIDLGTGLLAVLVETRSRSVGFAESMKLSSADAVLTIGAGFLEGDIFMGDRYRSIFFGASRRVVRRSRRHVRAVVAKRKGDWNNWEIGQTIEGS